MAAADGALLGAFGGGQAEPDGPARHDRIPLLGFARDATSLAILQEGLGAVTTAAALDLRRGSLRDAVAALSRMPSPQTLIVDVSEEDQPLAMLDELSQVVEPDVRVLVIGDRNDADFYRRLTRGLGVLEYLYKPLTAEIVSQHFGPVLGRRPRPDLSLRGGRVLAVTGARGGIGTTTVAVNLAWMLAEVDRRYTCLVDGDLHTGTASMMLGVEGSSGLRAALERPERVDELFVERAARPVNERLHVLASEESLTELPDIARAGPERLIATLRRRYNFVVLDVPFAGRSGPMRDLLSLADQRVLVTEPSLAAVRDTLRLLALPPGPTQHRRPFVLLNRGGRRGGLSQKQVEEALLQKPDLVIPDMEAKLNAAATLGEPAASKRGTYRSSMARLARELASVGVAEPATTGWRLFRRRA